MVDGEYGDRAQSVFFVVVLSCAVQTLQTGFGYHVGLRVCVRGMSVHENTWGSPASIKTSFRSF